MLISNELQAIERQILEKLPRLLEQDAHFRIMIEGILTEKFPQRDDFAALLEEIRALRMESNQRFEAMQKEMGRRFEAMDTRFEALQQQLEASRQQSEKRFEAMDRRFEEIFERFRDLKHSVDLQVGGFQRRAGRRLENMVAGTLRLALDRRDIRSESIVLRKKIEDRSGLIGLPGKSYEIDLWAHNESVMFFEIKSVPEVEDVERFSEKCRLAASLLGYEDYEQVMVSLDKPEEVVEACRALGVQLV